MYIELIRAPEFRGAIPARAQQLDLSEEKYIVSHLTKKVAIFAIIFFKELPKATISTLFASLYLFKKIFKADYGLFPYIIDPILIVGKTILIVAYLGISIILQANRAALNSVSSKTDLSKEVILTEFAGSNIDIGHIKSGDENLDISGLHYTRDDTFDFLESKVNDADRESLKKFIYNIKNRIAFLGTPPQYNLTALDAFYTQIENAICLAVEKVRGAEDEHEQIQILTADFAEAGRVCGARYMSEAMSAYYRLCSDDMNSETSTLKKTFEKLLSAKRLEIALKQCRTDLGTDAHNLPRYLQDFGNILGLPGVKNVTEQIAFKRLDSKKFLPKFFAAYSEKTIIDTIKVALGEKENSQFREEIIRWIEDQLGTWDNPESILETQINDTMQECLDSKGDLVILRKGVLVNTDLKKLLTKKQIQDRGFLSTNPDVLKAAVTEFYREFYMGQIVPEYALRLKEEFMRKLGIHKPSIVRIGLPEPVLIWVLISNGILTGKDYIDQDLVKRLGIPLQQQVSVLPHEIIYSQDEKLRAIFNRQFKENPTELINRYPEMKAKFSIKKVCLINLAKLGDIVMNNIIVKTMALAIIVFLFIKFLFLLYLALHVFILKIPYLGAASIGLGFISSFIGNLGLGPSAASEITTLLYNMWISCSKVYNDIGGLVAKYHRDQERPHIRSKEAIELMFNKWKDAIQPPLLARSFALQGAGAFASEM